MLKNSQERRGIFRVFIAMAAGDPRAFVSALAPSREPPKRRGLRALFSRGEPERDAIETPLAADTVPGWSIVAELRWVAPGAPPGWRTMNIRDCDGVVIVATGLSKPEAATLVAGVRRDAEAMGFAWATYPRSVITDSAGSTFDAPVQTDPPRALDDVVRQIAAIVKPQLLS